MAGSVILGGARTPFGKFSGSLAGFSGAQLGGKAIAGALERTGISADQVDYVLMGQVLQAGAGQITARQAAVEAGIPIMLADLLIQAGEAEIIVAGGMESMTNAPYLLRDARSGMRMGDKTVVDSMMHDSLFCAIDELAMGASTEQYAGKAGLNRDVQDELSAQSHERAAAAQKDGKFDNEIISVEIPQRKGDPIVLEADEGVRPGTTAESLGKLRPAFAKDGNITAGNASQISDGGAAVIVCSAAKAEELGLKPLGEIVAIGQVAGPDASLISQPAQAIKAAMAKVDLTVDDIDLFELNEAFAAVGVQSMKDLGISDDIVNVNGGAIAIGHPVGVSGTRIVLTLLNELARRGGGTGAAALCGGGGQGDALIVRTV